MQSQTTALITLIWVALISQTQAQTLTGSRASMERQHQHAVEQGYSFLKTSYAVTSMVNSGELVKVNPSQHLALHDVSFAYARPAVKTLLDRLAAQYHGACGEKLTVTSITRPIERQPDNAARDSVHPTGMAFDLRIPAKPACRTWLETTLLALEKEGVLDATRERRPPHYHVAVFPQPYVQYLAQITGQNREYIVRSGDTLSVIAARTNTSVAQLRAANGLRGDLINIGQRLEVPATTASIAATSGPAVPAQTSDTASVAVNARQAPLIAANSEITHQVRAGENLWRIANRYRISVDALRNENGLADDLLRVGQVLRIISGDS
jgi:LysM repeat protein